MQEILQANYDGDSLHFQCGDQKVLRTGPWKWKVLHDFDWASHLLCRLSPGLCWISSHVLEQAEFGEWSRWWAKAKMAAERLFVFSLQQTPAWMVSLWGTNSEWILKGTKGKNHPPGFTWNCSLRARRWSSTWNSLQFQSEAEVWGLQLPAQPRQDDLKEKISQIQIEGGSRVSCSQNFLIPPCLRCTEEYFLFFPAKPSSTSTWCPKCKEPLQTRVLIVLQFSLVFIFI